MTTTPMQLPAVAEALGKLRQGHERFLQERRTFSQADLIRRVETSRHGQQPYAAILGCSDSRAPLEVIFDAGIGDLFAVRIPGALCREDTLAALEYAVGHLGVPVVLVLGHNQCGAVAGYLGGAAGNGYLARLLSGVAPAAREVRQRYPEYQGPRLVDAVARESVLRAVEAIQMQEGVIRNAWLSGEVHIAGAMYDIASGSIEWL